MIPLPDPGRLFPPKQPPSGGSGSASLADGLLGLGNVGVLLVVTAGGGALAYAISPWLTIPGALLSFGLGMAVGEAPPLVLGVIEAVFYSFITYLFSGGFERPDPGHSLAYSAIVAAIFLCAAFLAWRQANPGRMRLVHALTAIAIAVATVVVVSVVMKHRAEELANGTTAHASDALAAGNVDAAIDAARTATRRAGDAQSFEVYGAALAAGGRFKEAAQAYAEVIRLKPDDPTAYLGRAEARRAVGDLKEAIEDYRAIVNLQPESPLYREQLSDAERELSASVHR